jgi:hypothetical protein
VRIPSADGFTVAIISRSMQCAAHFALSATVVVLHCFAVVFISFTVGFFPEAFVGGWYQNSPLQAFVPCMSTVAILLGIFVARSSSLADKRACWAWIPGLLWFGFGVHDMLFAGNGVLQTGAWVGSTPFRSLLDNLFGGTSKCGDTECLYELTYTMPLVVCTAYSLASWITLKVRGASSKTLANS